jgi:hypothetical protein
MEEIENLAKANGRENAFPDQRWNGLTKREWFAGMALQGLLASQVRSFEACVTMSIIAADDTLKQLAESDGAK